MLFEFIKYGFISGEISKTLYGRSDLEKYDLAMAEAHNVFVDYRGGLSSRPGTRFIDYAPHSSSLNGRMISFNISDLEAEGYMVYLTSVGGGRIFFLKDGAFLLHGEQDVVDVQPSEGGTRLEITLDSGPIPAQGVPVYVDLPDYPELSNKPLVRTTSIGSLGFRLAPMPDEDPIDFGTLPPYTGGGTVRRYVSAGGTNYSSAELPGVRAHQHNNVIWLTHYNHPPQSLTFISETDWRLETLELGDVWLQQPSGLGAVADETGDAGVLFTVTAVDRDGREGVPAAPVAITGIENYAATDGSLKFVWNHLPEAEYFNIYRSSIVSDSDNLSTSIALGYIGRAFGGEFVDTNITPDFTRMPPKRHDPFAPGAVESIQIDDSGTDYTPTSEVTITSSTGSGFVGHPIVNSDGTLAGVKIIHAGSGYRPGDSLSISEGSGASGTFTLTPESGLNPTAATVFQQRLVFAGSLEQPTTVWGSQPKDFLNFDMSEIVNEGDSFEYDVEMGESSRIRHLLVVQNGLLTWAPQGIWKLSGGNDISVTALNAVAEPQTFLGVANVAPLNIESYILYAEHRSSTVRMLEYNELNQVFSGQDLSVLSNHLFGKGHEIAGWAYAKEPYKLVWAVREDGDFLIFAWEPEQNVYAWTPCSTKGKVKDIATLNGGVESDVYMVVERTVNGKVRKMLEIVEPRVGYDIEDAWAVDCGLTLPRPRPNAILYMDAVSGMEVEFTASAGVFPSDIEGADIRYRGGKATILERLSSTRVLVQVEREFPNHYPEDLEKTPLPLEAGEWELARKFQTVGGLEHLEGESVSILADGNVILNQVVENGAVELDFASSRVTVGLPYYPKGRTLPPTRPDAVIEAAKKRTVRMAVRLSEARGLKVGAMEDKLYPIKERTTELYGQATRATEGLKIINVSDSWKEDSVVYFRQENPLPFSILSLVLSVDLGK